MSYRKKTTAWFAPILIVATGLVVGLTVFTKCFAQTQATVTTAPSAACTLSIDLAHPGHKVSPILYGLMTEEINHSYDGGLYAELIQNRTFQDNSTTPSHWSCVQRGGAAGQISLDRTQPLNSALPVSLRVDVTKGGAQVGAANDGFWGVPIRPSTTYHASFYAKADSGFHGPLTLALESPDGALTYASVSVRSVTNTWKQYSFELKTSPTAPAQPLLGCFSITTNHAGTFWLNLISLFPPTYDNQRNGFRIDLMQKMAALHPAFLRLPGGNYVEGGSIAARYDWKKTIGPLANRSGHPSPWGYRSSDGLGLLEYLEWCEDLHMQPVLAVFAGYSLDGEVVQPGPALQPYVQDALDEIEYITGGPNTVWGAERIRDGHPKPFTLNYVEVGNEDGADRSGTYEGRFDQFYDAIKAKYPRLQLISTMGGKDFLGRRHQMTIRIPDVIDEHYYASPEQMEIDAHRFDSYDRKGPKIFVGEWASWNTSAPWEQRRGDGPTSALRGALADAAWLTGVERNSDVVIMASYAPMFVNVNPGARQWSIDLIGYDALSSFGSPSYYVQTMFDEDHGDVVLPSTLTGDQLLESATRDTKTGAVFIKLVNISGVAQPVQITLSGAGKVSNQASATTLSGTGLEDANTLDQPTLIVPITKTVSGIGPDFTYTIAPYCVTVLKINAS